MFRLINLIKRFRFFIFFILLETIAISLLIYFNSYHHSLFFNFFNNISSNYHEKYYNTTNYINLRDVNDSLLVENAKLRSELSMIKKSPKANTVFDSNQHYGFIYKPGHVINNSAELKNNFMTLDIGEKDDVEPLMGVISHNGVVGITKSVSKNFALVISILNTDFKVNAKISEVNEIGSVSWDGKSINQVILRDIPSNVKISKGQHVVVGPYSSFFPENYPIGEIVDYSLIKSGDFYTINVELATDVRNSTNIYVIKKMLKEEQENLEKDKEVEK